MEKKRENMQNERDSKYFGVGHDRVLVAKRGLEHRQSFVVHIKCLLLFALIIEHVCNIDLQRYIVKHRKKKSSNAKKKSVRRPRPGVD